jgi:hypothetical protein
MIKRPFFAVFIMIVVRIIGGLGNQMFQYAAGRALATKYNVPLKVDLRWMRGYRHRDFLLDKFPISIETPLWNERLKFTWFPFRRRPFFFYTKIIRKFNKILYMEDDFPYNTDFWNFGPDRFLFGYFQSEKYFKEYDSLIRKDFSYQYDPSLYDKEVVEAIRKSSFTAIQFRRGDYITNKATSSSIGLCSMDYYEKAVAYLKSKQKDFKLLIFSDDIQWCRQNIKFDRAVFVERKGGTPLDDMSLAIQCKNIIIANSTFSWWCAWLNTNPKKIVIAPQKWFKSEELNKNAYDLIPDDWIRI